MNKNNNNATAISQAEGNQQHSNSASVTDTYIRKNQQKLADALKKNISRRKVRVEE